MPPRMVFHRTLGLRGGLDTPTPNPDPQGHAGNVSDANVTRLSSIGLAKTPHTPHRQRIVDMMGEAVVGDLPHLLSELKLQLQALGPNKSGRSGPSSLAPSSGQSQEGPLSFKCDRAAFQNAQTLADYCHRLATTQAAGAPELAPEALMAGVHASIQDMETRMELALTEQAATLASAIDRLNAGVKESQTFAQAAKADHAHRVPAPTQRPPKQQGQAKPPAVPPPKALPELVLSQVTPGGRAELDTQALGLLSRINFTLAKVDSQNPPAVRALRRVHRTGDIILQFGTEDHAHRAQELSSEWIPLFNSNLKLKVKLYTIMVHGVPTTFGVDRPDEISGLINENAGLLDSLQSVRWANANSIAISKPFSSLFISLSDPEEANAAIYNKVNFGGELKNTERSKKNSGAMQCFHCQAYGHQQSACNSEPCCAHCADDHASKDCKRDFAATKRCINCTEAYVLKKRKTIPDYGAVDITPEESVPMAHSAQAAHCPIRRARMAPSRSRDYFLVTKQNQKTHAAR